MSWSLAMRPLHALLLDGFEALTYDTRRTFFRRLSQATTSHWVVDIQIHGRQSFLFETIAGRLLPLRHGNRLPN